MEQHRKGAKGDLSSGEYRYQEVLFRTFTRLAQSYYVTFEHWAAAIGCTAPGLEATTKT